MSHLSRIYPAGWRTDSSNYSPVEMWNGGCQIGTGWLGLGGGLGEGFRLEGHGPGASGDPGRARCRDLWAQELVISVWKYPPPANTVSEIPLLAHLSFEFWHQKWNARLVWWVS